MRAGALLAAAVIALSAAPAHGPAGPSNDWLALARAMAKPWPALEHADGTFADYVVRVAPRPPRDPYGRSFMGLALLQAGIRDHDGSEVKLMTRKGLDWTARFPPIAAALKSVGLSAALLDGEIVVEDSAGLPSFTLLQSDLKEGRADRFRYILFDLLYCEGFDLTKATLLDFLAALSPTLRSLTAASKSSAASASSTTA